MYPTEHKIFDQHCHDASHQCCITIEIWLYMSVEMTLVFNGTRFLGIFSLANVILILILRLSHSSNVKRQYCPNATELMLSQLTYTTEFLPLFNIDDQHYNNSGQMFRAQWDEFNLSGNKPSLQSKTLES